MQSINARIINPWFLTVFLGTAVCSLISALLAILTWDRPGVVWALGGAVLYLVGCTVVTNAFNVPLNDRLAAIDSENPKNIIVWKVYLARWMPWNHVRTVASLAATAAFITALNKMGAA